MAMSRAGSVILSWVLFGSSSIVAGTAYPQSVDRRQLDEARSHIADGDCQSALPLIERALGVDPNATEALRMASLCYWQLRRLEEGIPHLQRLVELSPDEPEAPLFLADYFGALGREESRLAALVTALERQPTHSKARELFRGAAMRAGVSLLGVFEARALAAPTDLDAQLALATMYRRHGRLVEHGERLEIAGAIAGDRAWEVDRERALAFVDVRAWDEALAWLTTALEAAPGEPSLLGTLARVHSQLGNSERAIAIYESLLEQAPGDPMLHFRLGEVYDSMNRSQEAESSYRSALRLLPSLPGVAYRLGKMHLDRGEVEEARVALARAVALDPGRAEVHLDLAHALDRLKRPDEARQTLSASGCRRPRPWRRPGWGSATSSPGTGIRNGVVRPWSDSKS